MTILRPQTHRSDKRLRASVSLITMAIFAVTGCGRSAPQYRENLLAMHRIEKETSEEFQWARPPIGNALEHYFGKLDDPRIPEVIQSDSQLSALLPLDLIERCSGEVGRSGDRIERGLYRKHCAICHGLSGDGFGPATSTLSPYPRDFRRGTFKWGLQGQNQPPSHADLLRIIQNGIPGTSMPGMQYLRESKYFSEDADALAHYIRFLAIRGEVERRLWLQWAPDHTAADFDAKHLLWTSDSDPAKLNNETWWKTLDDELKSDWDAMVIDVVSRWKEQQTTATPTTSTDNLIAQWPDDLTPDRRDALMASAARGETLFRSETTACAQCHGVDARGDGKLQDFDEWTKDWTIRAGIDPRDKAQWKPLRSLGLPKPVVDPARNLTLGVFRGGSDPSKLFDRIASGIDGTPMPAVARQATSPIGLTDDQIWDLVNYCQSLSLNAETTHE